MGQQGDDWNKFKYTDRYTQTPINRYKGNSFGFVYNGDDNENKSIIMLNSMR